MNRWQPLFRRSYDSIVSSVFALSVRHMSKYMSKQATKRQPLTTKRARKGYYKGKGGTKEGRLTSKGKFIVDPLKRLQLIVPDLEGFKLKPYVALGVPKEAPENRSEQMPSSH
ncbi:Ribosomal protein [Seminavis robusta]|uniref:Ribosomal protein n=1 Tax=Seminavis robusta TaxID=568900 RepID=A0A9N8DT26_9STRA|nr:Ribosomal protein [Seminavis robusta]|eukprot:Sro351_g123880.1 Ribosomal protein (113) ;mRNA; f:23840-24295